MALKTLHTCKPTEFLRQTNLIRKSVSKWLTDTDILNIRKRLPVYETAPADASAEERAAVIKRNAAANKVQARKNLSAMLDAMLDEHPDETLEVLALCCFVDPENVDDYPITDYLEAFTSLISDEAVLGFFTSLASLGQTDISPAYKR